MISFSLNCHNFLHTYNRYPIPQSLRSHTQPTIFAAWKAAFALTRAAGLANVQAARSSRAAGMAAAVAEATKVIKDRSCMVVLGFVWIDKENWW
jgi:hypothetical protein